MIEIKLKFCVKYFSYLFTEKYLQMFLYVLNFYKMFHNKINIINRFFMIFLTSIKYYIHDIRSRVWKMRLSVQSSNWRHSPSYKMTSISTRHSYLKAVERRLFRSLNKRPRKPFQLVIILHRELTIGVTRMRYVLNTSD